jgi:hypothetical protein
MCFIDGEISPSGDYEWPLQSILVNLEHLNLSFHHIIMHMVYFNHAIGIGNLGFIKGVNFIFFHVDISFFVISI